MCSTKYAKITKTTKRKIINGKCEFEEIGSFCACKKKLLKKGKQRERERARQKTAGTTITNSKMLYFLNDAIVMKI